MNSYNAFTKEKVIENANTELAAHNKRARIVDIQSVEDNVAIAVTKSGALLVLIMCGFGNISTMGFRGIHRVVNKTRRFTYLINGQPNINLSQIIFSGENGTRYYAGILDVMKFYNAMYVNIKDQNELLNMVNKRISWDAKGNHVLQNQILSALGVTTKIQKAHDYTPINEFESAVLFNLCPDTGKVFTVNVGEINLKVLVETSPEQGFYLTKTVVTSTSGDKAINVAMARCLWTKLGNVPVTDDDEIDEDFLHFSEGTETSEIWHWFEENFSICLGDDIICGGKTQELAS